ncbi:MAG: hypothetical protein LLF75_00565 [Eubacteriales bacterium]|nr:hypothetical protein [Eubacteriales bacterium]
MLGLNIIALVMGYAAIILIARTVYRDNRITLVTAILLALFAQAIFFTSFIYSNIFAFACISWACLFLIRWINHDGIIPIIWIVLLCAVAVLVKPNSWIAIIAISIILFFSMLRQPKIAKVICIIGCSVLLSGGVQRQYELRSGISIGTGTPKTAWLVMGLTESPPDAPGWFNGYAHSVLQDNGMDIEQAGRVIRNDLDKRFKELENDPAKALSFFHRKVLSQWNEPSFESVWVSKVKAHKTATPWFVNSIYNSTGGKIMDAYFEQYVQLIYVAFVLGSLFHIIRSHKKETRFVNEQADNTVEYDEIALLLPLIVFGGVAYHLLFEAKSQYALLYIPWLIPSAASGLVRFSDLLHRK